MTIIRAIKNWFTPSMIFLTIATLAFLTASVETDTYVPSFPNMLAFFQTTEYKMELLLSLNFIGLCVSGLIYGPLSDSFGRKRTMLVGLALFVASSIGCVVTNSIDVMIALRLIQGLGAGAIFGVMPASFFDLYEEEKAGKVIAYMMLVISAAMTCAPILGAWVNNHFGWRANFSVVAVLSIVTFVLVLTHLKETLPAEKRIPFRPREPFLNYLKLLKSFRYLGNAAIMGLMSSSMLVYVASLSLIFINHLHVSPEAFSYHQAAVLVACMLASFTLTRSIERLGAARVRDIGACFYLLGSTMLFLCSILAPKSAILITISMVIGTFGACFAMVAFHTAAVAIFPNIKGAANAFSGSLRLAIIAFLIYLGGKLFNGTIFPVALIIFTTALTCVALFLGLKVRQYVAGAKVVAQSN